MTLLESIHNDRQEGFDELKAFKKDVGAGPGYLAYGEGVIALNFKSEPDLKLWRKREGWWYPLRKTKTQKANAERLHSIHLPGPETCSSVMLKEPFVMKGRTLHYAGWLQLPNAQWVIIAEESDKWKPVKGLKPMKRSTFYRLKGE